jgi:hypothetical protein
LFSGGKKMEDFFDDGFDWEDWMLIGPLSEDIAEEEREKERIRKQHNTSGDDYWDIINLPW